MRGGRGKGKGKNRQFSEEPRTFPVRDEGQEKTGLIYDTRVRAMTIVKLFFVFGAMIVKLFLISAFIAAVVARTKSNSDTDEAIKYLTKYGYLNGGGGGEDSGINAKSNSSALRDAIIMFQDYLRLPGEGVLTDETMSYMRKQRCGVRDIPHRIASHHIWVAWPRKNLTWNLHMATKTYLDTAREAFDLWARNSGLTFTRITGHSPDILISFQTRAHPNMHDKSTARICTTAFDGPGKVVAHATIPNGRADFAGEIHLDHEEMWHVTINQNPPDKTSLLDVLTHEIGHALGLDHNTRNDSVMFPFVVKRTFPLRLSIEDVLIIQNLYGSKDEKDVQPMTTTVATTTTTTTITSPTTNRRPDTELCSLKNVDVFLVANHRLYVMYKRYIWSSSLDGRRLSNSMLLTDYLTFLPPHFKRITAVYQRPSGDIILFINDLMYSINNPDFTLQADWPKNITTLHIPANAKINAAINTNTGRTFIVYDNRFVVEIDERRMSVVRFSTLDETFPGIPSTITSAFRYIDGNLYFLDKNRRTYYVFNEFTNTITKAGTFDMTMVNVVCPTDGLVEQIYTLLRRIATINNVFLEKKTQDDDDDDDADDDE